LWVSWTQEEGLCGVEKSATECPGGGEGVEFVYHREEEFDENRGFGLG
jgi:hypothetical protein